MKNRFLAIILFSLTFLSCYSNKNIKFGEFRYKSHFQKKQLVIVKKEFPELYKLLKKGELLECIDCPDNKNQYLYSGKLINLIDKNLVNFCRSDYMSKLGNFSLVFGEKIIVEKMNYNQRILVKLNANVYEWDTDLSYLGIPTFLFYEDGKMVCPGSG